MKTILFALIAIVFTSVGSFAGGKEKITIKTSAQCGECIDRITGSLMKTDGIKSVTFDEAMNVTVTYDSEKTNPDAIRTLITEAGYDADDKLANQKAYKKLPGCCQKPDSDKTK